MDLSADAEWAMCDARDAELLGAMNAQLSEDEGGQPIGALPVYVTRMRGWLETGRYQAAVARQGDEALAYVLWRDDQDYGDDQALVFTSPMGTPLRHSNFYRRAWLPAVAKAGLPGIHFHDLRHAGNTLTADAGASLRELMDRMGHSSTRAALIYQHSSDERQRKLADAIGQAARAALLKTATASGTHVARETGSHP
jgi:integrase